LCNHHHWADHQAEQAVSDSARQNPHTTALTLPLLLPRQNVNDTQQARCKAKDQHPKMVSSKRRSTVCAPNPAPGSIAARTRLPRNEETVATAALAVAESKALTTEAAILATNKLFELAGTRSTSGVHNLDRHWRNARTHTLHDPVRWKYFIIGHYHLNGVKPARHPWL
jgi:alkylation response protein AidB-like acyl-CoA dehydrogenase